MKKIAVVGARGKMGQEILQILAEKNLKTTGFSEATKPPTKASLKGHDLVIDFSSPQGFDQALRAAQEANVAFVSGTTGISPAQKKNLEAASKKIPLLWAPNMSLGVALLKKAIEHFAQLEEFDFQIEEFHHNKKKDRPSGTALALEESLSQALKKNKKKVELPQTLVGRAGGIIGIHKVYAVSAEEMLCFEHQALSRRVFAVGAVRAGLWLTEQKPGLYSMEDLFDV